MKDNHFTKGINPIRLNPLNNRHFALLFILLNSILGVNNAMQAQCTPATQTFNYTGGVQDFVVPNSINRITFSATGADGGDGGGSTGNGGSGGSINANFSVSPGDNIRLIVGQAGESTIWGGGGGGTAVINCGNPANCATGTLLIVAGGGGGGRGNNPGGGATAVAGSGAAGSNDVGGGGGGGVNGGGGVSFDGAQASKTSISAGGFGGNVSNGGKGFGGGGALQSIPGGGGGGGGYTGGNGTIDFGYGGSNYVDASAIAGFNNTAGIDGGSGGNNTNGVVVLSYTCPDPCLVFTNNRAYVNDAVTSSGDGSSWATAFKTLQEALTLNCPSITQIWVAQGTYSPTTTANRTISFVMKNGLAIYGGFDGTENSLFQRNWETNVTTLSGSIGGGESSYHVINNFYTSSNQLSSSAILDGFTVTGGLANGNSIREDVGGGMHNQYASPTIKNCIFTGNNAQFAGGGICNLNSAASISNCTFSNNSASNYEGGGIFNYSPNAFPPLYSSVTNSTFSNNSARSGGGISNRGSLYGSSSTSNGRGPSITYCTFTNNSVSSYGGGISTDSIDPTVNHCVFTGNTAGGYGGGLFSGHASKGASYCSFSDNSATNNGGGIYAYSNNFTASYVNCSFYGNTATDGGGIYLATFVSLVNSSFSGNTASSNGGGIWVGVIKMVNCIVWGNNSEIFVANSTNSSNTVTYSIVKQASGVYSGTGNLNVDPLFVGGGNLHLQNSSPAINAGTATGAPGDDFDGDPRPLGGGYDMGYDEVACSPSTAPLSISGISTICSGNSTTLTLVGGSAGSGATADWSANSCDGVVIGVGNSITVSPTTNTTYFVKYNGTCGTTTCASINVAVNTPSTAPTSISGTSTICNGGSTTLTLVGGSAGTGAIAEWSASSCSGTVIGTGNSITVSPSTPTTYFVKYNGTCNTTTCASQLINVNTPSTAPTSISGVSTICNGGSTTLTLVGGSAGTGAIAEWSASSCSGTVIGTGNSITVSPSTPTTYFVKYNGTCNVTACASQLINVNTPSTAPVSISGISTICSGSSTTLTLVGGSAGTSAIAEWSASSCGGAVIGTGNSITVSPSSATTYFVKYNGTCNTTTCASQLINVNTPSTAPTSISGVSTICNGGSTTLTLVGGSAGTGAIAEWSASSCSGTVIGTGNSITVSPSTPTTYFVKYNGTCNTTTCASQLINVNTLSIAPTSISGVSTICNGGSTTLTLVGGSAGTGAIAEWSASSCGGAVIGTGNSITVSPSTPITYFVKYNGTCNTTTCASQLINVNTLSIAPTSISGVSTICNGGSTTLTLVGGSAGTGAIAEWSASSCGGAVIGTGNSITVSPSSATTYFVKYNGTCNVTACASISVTVNTPSVAPLSISGISTICNGESTTLTFAGGSAGTGAVAEWSTSCGGAVIGTGSSITVSPSTPTTYFVKYNGTCNVTACASISVTVNTLSTAPTSISGVSTICQGNSTTLSAVGGFAGTGAVAEWFTGSCGGTSAGTGNSIIVAPTVNTTYYVRYKGTCNTTSCASVKVTITTPSVGGILSPAQSQGCGPTTVNLSVSGINGAVTQWERQANCTGAWASIGSAGLSAITTTTPNQTSCYRVAITNGVCPTAYSTIATVTVDKPAVGGKVTLQSNQNASSVSLCSNQNAILIPKNYVGKVVKWQFSVSTSSTWVDLPGSEDAQTLTVNGATVPITIFYRVVVVTELGLCTGQASVAYSSAFRITKKPGCSSPDGSVVNTDEQTKQHLTIQKVYPNPASNLVSLEIESYTEGVTQFEILDVTGRQVLKQTATLTEGMNSISLDISHLSRGVFIVKMTDSQNQKAMVKMVKE